MKLAQRFRPWPAILLMTTLAAVGSSMAQSAVPIAQLRDELKTIQSTLDRLELDQRLKCDSAKRALAGFVDSSDADAAASQKLASEASTTRDACTDAQSATKQAQRRADVLWDNLKGQLAAPPLPTILTKGVGELIDAAAGAQKLVDTARADYADPYEAGDSAAKNVLESKALSVADRAALVKRAQDARTSASRVRQHLTEAQRSANKLVQQALLLKKCEPGCNDESVRQSADAASSQLRAALAAAKTDFESAKKDGLFATLGVLYTDPKQRENAIAFAALLDTFPDARGVLGEASAFGLSARGTGSEATVKLGGAKNMPFGWRQTAFTLSAPLNSSQNPQLYTRGAGFNDAASLGASRYWVTGGNSGSLFRGDTYLTAAGIKGSLGLGGKLSYKDEDLKTDKTSERVLREGSLGAYVALFTQSRNGDVRTGNPGVHLLSLDLKRTVNRGAEQIRCPVPSSATAVALPCVKAYFTAPKFGYSRKLAYEYRYQVAKYAFAPRVEYDSEAHLTTVRLPYYWIRSDDPTAKGALNAGFDFVWSRGRDDDGNRKIERSLGIFVGMPFSMSSVSRD